MKKRLRKKHRLDEFREFRVEFTADESVLDEFIEINEENNLQYGGGFVEATEAQRIIVRTWVLAHSEIEDIKVGPLVDVE